MTEEARFVKLCKIMDTLLGENGCPWDKAQTHRSLRPHLLEECYEAADAIDRADMPALCEEMGDLLLQVLFHGRLAEKADQFSLSDILESVSDKLISRHTHIFGADTASSVEDVKAIWEANKNKEKQIASPAENMRAVPKAMPALMRADKVLKRAKLDFSAEHCLEQIRVALAGLESAGNNQMEQIGKILLHIAALSTKLQINAEISLTNSLEAFINDFD